MNHQGERSASGGGEGHFLFPVPLQQTNLTSDGEAESILERRVPLNALTAKITAVESD